MISGSALSTLATGPIRSGHRAIDQLADIVRERGAGRALVVYDHTATASGAQDLVISALQTRGIRSYAAAADSGDGPDYRGLMHRLHQLDGALIMTVGDGRTINLGKVIAATANNDTLTDHIGTGLPRAPLPHIAVPTEPWPPVEVTDVLEVDPSTVPNPASVIRDSRLTPTAVIDGRLHQLRDPQAWAAATELALAVAACAAVDPARSLDEKTRALAAAHALTGRAATPAAHPHQLATRVAISLAGASHTDYLLCHRCAAGHRLLDETTTEPATPAEACLREALIQR